MGIGRWCGTQGREVRTHVLRGARTGRTTCGVDLSKIDAATLTIQTMAQLYTATGCDVCAGWWKKHQ